MSTVLNVKQANLTEQTRRLWHKIMYCFRSSQLAEASGCVEGAGVSESASDITKWQKLSLKTPKNDAIPSLRSTNAFWLKQETEEVTKAMSSVTLNDISDFKDLIKAGVVSVSERMGTRKSVPPQQEKDALRVILQDWGKNWAVSMTSLKSDSHLPKRIVCFNDSPSKMTKNAFYVTLQALFVLKIFKFLSWLFGHVDKTTWLERKVNFEIYDVTAWLTKNYNTHIV